METKHLNIKVHGKVQGVFFRTATKNEADKLNLKGFVKNESDGTVYIEAEGDKASLDTFLAWCKDGPQAATVERIEVTEDLLKNFLDFSRDFADY